MKINLRQNVFDKSNKGSILRSLIILQLDGAVQQQYCHCNEDISADSEIGKGLWTILISKMSQLHEPTIQ